MKVLVIGSGGREHALLWKLALSSKVTELYCAPGNDGMKNLAERVLIDVEDLDGLLELALSREIDLTVVGPEVLLVSGIVDKFEKAGLKIFGPNKAAAMLEGSKAFAKNLMKKYNIPTAEYEVFDDPRMAKEYIKKAKLPLVIKADGLAAGKGVLIAWELKEALEGVEGLMEDKRFGSAGKQIIIEEFLEGAEVSVLAFSDGETVLSMIPAHDHKAVFDGDEGPNTGGMGAFCPSHVVDDTMVKEIEEKILRPTMQALKNEGIKYKGVLYAGLMLTNEGPKVLEFNARFGDPETQVILPLLENDLVEVLEAVVEERLKEVELRWKDKKAVTVIMASGGYPLSYEKGIEIKGLNLNGQISYDDVLIFHAGTRYQDGKWLTNGGRVLAVTALGSDFLTARERAYWAVNQINFEKAHYRMDIGSKALRPV